MRFFTNYSTTGRKLAAVALGGYAVAAMLTGTCATALAIEPTLVFDRQVDVGSPSATRPVQTPSLLVLVNNDERIRRAPILGIPIRGRLGGGSPSCCPNSMLVCPLPRHFCK